MTATHRVYGPPGTGKTSYLARQAARAAAKYGAGAVMVASLTRAAAAEVAGRDTGLPRENVGTLHAHAYRALEGPHRIAESRDGVRAWNARVGPHLRLDPPRAWRPGEELEAGELLTPDPDADGDRLLLAAAALRARKLPEELWPASARGFHARWCEWKREEGWTDFTDLLERCLADVDRPACRPSVLLLDEAQDFSRLEMALALKWGATCDQLVVVGDPDQCQPAGTLVTTTDGPVPIEQLDPDRHRLVSFDRRGSTLVGRRDGYSFEIASRRYRGRLVTVRVDDRETRCTHDHRWAVKWAPESREKLVVYLMRRGEWWRVGWCKLHGSDGLHLNIRSRLDGADDTWVLDTFDDRRQASLYETEVAVRYGLPLPTFREADVHEQLNRAQLDLENRAHRCLIDHGRDPLHPLVSRTRRNEKQGRRTSLVVRACNLLPGLMLIPVPVNRRTVSWEHFTVRRAAVASKTKVWSMNIEPHHTYVADGIVTMNNLYSWRGTDPEAFAESEVASVTVLEQSWRVPRAVHALAVRWIERWVPGREPVAYQPRDADGAVERCPLDWRWDAPRLARRLERELDERDGTLMVLASCGYMLGPLIAELRRRGVPFHNPYRRSHGGWNPLRGADRLLAFLRPDPATWGDRQRLWTWEDVRKWADPLRADGVFERGAKAFIEAKGARDPLGSPSPEAELGALHNLFAAGQGERALDLDVRWWLGAHLARRRQSSEYPVAVHRARGGTALRETPRLVLGTIHSVKGGEADGVYLFPDLSRQGLEAWERPADGDGRRAGREAIARQFYVGATRARERLVLCSPAGSNDAVPIWRTV